MAANYQVARVGDFAESISDTHPMDEERLVFLNTSDVLGGHILHRTYTAVKDWPGQAKKSIRRHDILFSEIRPANGRWAYVDEKADDFVVSTKLMVIRTRSERLLPRYLYHFLTSTQITKWLQHLAESRSGTFPQITFDQVASLEIPLPSIAEQAAIADALDTLGGKIDLNRRMNETLEAVARTLFNSWFVEFDPVRAKAEGCDPGLPKHVADLFPNQLGTDGVPVGWTAAPLPELIEVNPPRPLRKGETAPYLDMANMPTQGHMPDAWIDRPFGSGMRFVNGDTLVARITPCLENGKTAWVAFLHEGQTGWGSTEFIVLRPKAGIPAVFAYCLARSEEFRQFAIQKMTGSSGRQRVPSESLSRFMLAKPPEQVFRVFGRLVEPLFARATANAMSSRTLAGIRDALLPKLLSGELRIPHVERLIRRVT